MKYFVWITCSFLFFSCLSKKGVTTISKNESLSKEYVYTFTDATKQYYLQNYKLALLLYNNYLKDNPESAAANYQISNILIKSGDIKKAEQYAKKAVELEEENVWYKYHLAKIYSYQKDYQSALDIYSDLSSEEENVDIQFSAARLYAMNGKYRKALEVLNNIEKNNGINEEMALLKHQIYKNMGKEKKAVNEIEKLLQLNPDKFIYYGILGEFYYEIGKNDKAEFYYEKLIQNNDKSINGLLSAADFYRLTGNYSKANDFYLKALNLNTDEKIAVQTLLSLVNDQNFASNSNDYLEKYFDIIKSYISDIRLRSLKADYYVKLEKYVKAESAIEDVLELDERNPVLWDQYLFVLNFLEKEQKLDSVADYVISNYENLPTAYLFKGLNLSKNENYSDAIDVLNAGYSKSDNNNFLKLQFLTFLGEAYNELEKFEKSDSVFDKALSIDPDNILILNNYSYYLSLRNNNLDKALEMSERTIKSNPNNPTYLDTYAWILYKKGNFNKAYKYIKKAYSNLRNANSEILEHYIKIAEELGKEAEATIIKKELELIED